MLELWGRKNSSNVMAVTWALGEIGLKYQRHNAGGSFGGLDTAEYRKLNPNARIPTLVDNGEVLWESNAIVRYLSRQYSSGTLWPDRPYTAAVADQWMDWVNTTFYPAFHPVFFGMIRTPVVSRNQESIDRHIPLSGNLLELVDGHLADNVYLAGNAFTMGDIPLGAVIHRYFTLDIERPPLPHVEAWYERLCERPAYQDNVMLPFGSSPEEWLELERQDET